MLFILQLNEVQRRILAYKQGCRCLDYQVPALSYFGLTPKHIFLLKVGDKTQEMTLILCRSWHLM